MTKTYGDNKLLNRYIKFEKFTHIENGIKKTVNWYKNFKQKNILDFKKIKY